MFSLDTIRPIKLTHLDKLIGYALLTLCLILNGFFLSFAAFRGFNIFDYGAFLDASWRVYRGQLPYIDFIYSVGPIHLYLNSLFFHIFGFGKTAILLHLIIVNSIVVVATFLLSHKKIPITLSALTAALTQVGFYWQFPHPWYDYTSYLWVILSLSILVRTLPFTSEKQAKWVSFSSGLLATFAFFTKTNIGIAYLPSIFVVLLLSDQKMVACLYYTAGILITTIAVIFLIRSPSLLLDNVFMGYGAMKVNQMGRLLFLPAWFKNLYWLPFVIVYFFVKPILKSHRAFYVLFNMSVLTAIFSLNTGSIRWPHNIPLLGAIIGMALMLLYGHRDAFLCSNRKWFFNLLLLVLVTGVVFKTSDVVKFSFQRALGDIEEQGFSKGDYQLRAEPLRGWRLGSSDGQLIDQMVEYIDQNIPRDQSLLILENLQILYCLTKRDSYRGVPFLFDLPELPARGEQLSRVRTSIINHPPKWLLISREQPANFDYDFLAYLELPPTLLSQYRRAKDWQAYALFKKI